MIRTTSKGLLSVAILVAAAGLYGCASTFVQPPDDDATAACQITAAAASAPECNSADRARQLRDAADYKDEPALGYLESPPGLLPIPTTSRNSSSN
jgi:hypothetical protein